MHFGFQCNNGIFSAFSDNEQWMDTATASVVNNFVGLAVSAAISGYLPPGSVLSKYELESMQRMSPSREKVFYPESKNENVIYQYPEDQRYLARDEQVVMEKVVYVDAPIPEPIVKVNKMLVP